MKNRKSGFVAIVGRPNAGKSSLFNALVGAHRAIVTAIPGTTRDLLTEVVDLRGLRVTLIDTAGLTESDDPVEREGVKRARHALAVSDLILIVCDGSDPAGLDGLSAMSGPDGPYAASGLDGPDAASGLDGPYAASGPYVASGLQTRRNIVQSITNILLFQANLTFRPPGQTIGQFVFLRPLATAWTT